MEIVFWIGGLAALLMMGAYLAIGASLLAAKYRMTHLRPVAALTRGAPIRDLRYRAP